MLLGIFWHLFADILEQPIGSTLNNQEAQEKCEVEVHMVLQRWSTGQVLALSGSERASQVTEV
jgi:hypothetical protein